MNLLALGILGVMLLPPAPKLDKCALIADVIRETVVVRDRGVPFSTATAILTNNGFDVLIPAIKILYENRKISPAVAADTFFEVCHEDDSVKESNKVLELPSQK